MAKWPAHYFERKIARAAKGKFIVHTFNGTDMSDSETLSPFAAKVVELVEREHISVEDAVKRLMDRRDAAKMMFNSINDKLTPEEKRDIRNVLNGINEAGRSLIDTGEALYLLDHTDRDGLDKRGKRDGFSAKMKIDTQYLSKNEIEQLKKDYEDGVIGDEKDISMWIEKHTNKQRHDISNNISSEVGRTNADNAGLHSVSLHKGNARGRSDNGSETNIGESKRVTVKTGFDGTNSPRYTDVETGENVEFMRTPDGTVYGWVETDENGVKHMYLNTEEGVFNANTPVHEMGHFWIQTLKEVNNELWKKGTRARVRYNQRTINIHLTYA